MDREVQEETGKLWEVVRKVREGVRGVCGRT